MIPSLLSTIKEDASFGFAADGSPALAVALPTILPLTSMTCLIGKLALGTVTDRLGGSLILVLVFCLFALSSAGLIVTKSVEMFGAMWVLNSLAYTSAWGAATQLIHATFPKEEWPTQISSIATAGRLGAAAGAIVYGSLLAQSLTWRQVFAVPLLMQLLLVLLCLWQHQAVRRMQRVSAAEDEVATSAAKADPVPGSSTVTVTVWSVLATADFWLMLTAKCSLFVFTQWFMNFVGLYLRSTFAYSPTGSTNAISVANAGQMVGLLIGGRLYKTLAPRAQAYAVAVALAVTTLVPAALYMRASFALVETLVLPLLFVWGLSFSVPFYLPPGTYALECGGRRYSTFFTNLLDAGGFTLSSVWNWYAAAQSKKNAFDQVLWTLVCLGAISLCTMPLVMLRRLSHAKKD